MARPQKEGIDYFSVDCQFSDSVKLIGAEFGLIGYGCLMRLWQKIYGGKGYYTDWNNDVALMFAQENGAGVNVVKELILACLRRGIFNRDLFDRYGILTSEGIQERFAEATERRVSQKIDERYLLIPIPSNWVSADNNRVNVDNNGENVDDNTQSKVKESKVNKSIVKERENAPTRDDLKVFGSFGNVLLTEGERNQLITKFGKALAEELIESFSKKLKSKGYKYDDHYSTILLWADKDGKKPSAEVGGSFNTDDFFEAAIRRGLPQKG